MVLSDRTIKEEIAAGRLVFDPYDEALVQPSSVDMRVDRSFRVFNNSRYPYIDVREPMENLTELVTVEDGEPFVLHRRVRAWADARAGSASRRSRGAARGQELAGA